MKLIPFAYFILSASMFAIGQEPAIVQIKQSNNRFAFFINGNEYHIKGAGCEFGNIDLLAACGANTVRTWKVDNGKETGEQVLEKAHKDGLMVFMGLDVTPQRQGFNYNDTLKVRMLKDKIRSQILRLRNFPALMTWGIGNELNYDSSDPKVWDVVNDIAVMIHQLDPNHPVTTMLAGINNDIVNVLKNRCPDLDFLSIQLYGDLMHLPAGIKESNYGGPYVVSEWGVTGHWQVAKTAWQAPIEQTGTEKAAIVEQSYLKGIKADSLHCIGNFIFIWEQKQERTPTWYGLFTESGEKTEAIDIMYRIWNNKWPENRCPSVSDLLINGKKAIDNCYLSPGEKINAVITATDPDQDTLTYRWEILPESTDLKTGGEYETRPKTLDKITTTSGTAELIAPADTGAYRLFVYVLDGHHHAGTANIPFYVK